VYKIERSSSSPWPWACPAILCAATNVAQMHATSAAMKQAVFIHRRELLDLHTSLLAVHKHPAIVLLTTTCFCIRD
jgi:hypothetical protein